MLADFMIRAWFAATGLALVAGPLGCFVVWRRMAYFGDTLAHSALLGVMLGLVLGIDPVAGVALTCIMVALLLVLLQQQRGLAADTLLGILAHGALALGLVGLSFFHNVRVDLMGYLFGDVLAVTGTDLVILWIGAAGALALLALIWRPLLLATLHEELAQAEGLPVLRLRLGLMLLMAVTVAVSMKIVGVLLITSMLIIPAAAARLLASTPQTMARIAAGLGVIAASLGLAGSWIADTPAGASIIVAALAIFLVSRTAVSLGHARFTRRMIGRSDS